MKILVFVFLLFVSLAALALPPESTLTFKGGVFSAYIGQDISRIDPKIEKAVITVHGSERNAHTYFNSIEMLSKKFQVADKTIIIAPHFKNTQDTLIAGEMKWTDEGWLRGDEAVNNKSASSFALMDDIIATLHKNFPKLKEVILTGHSAGGQFVQRYAVGSSLEKSFPKTHFRYVVTNPGSYLYLTRTRPVMGPINCAYNDYKFGLDHLNSYMAKREKSLMIAEYLSKDVFYMVGEADTISGDIDQTCPAQYQGINRLYRGINFKTQLDREFIQNAHQLRTVPGVGHTQYGMYTSDTGSKVLFE
jgi:hypothetical protein